MDRPLRNPLTALALTLLTRPRSEVKAMAKEAVRQTSALAFEALGAAMRNLPGDAQPDTQPPPRDLDKE